MKRSKPVEAVDKNSRKKIDAPEKKGEEKKPVKRVWKMPTEAVYADSVRQRNKERGRAQGCSCSLFKVKSLSSRHNKNAPQHRTDLPVGKRKSKKYGGDVSI